MQIQRQTDLLSPPSPHCDGRIQQPRPKFVYNLSVCFTQEGNLMGTQLCRRWFLCGPNHVVCFKRYDRTIVFMCLLVTVPSFSPIFPFLKYHMGVIKFLNCFLSGIFQLSTQPWIQKHKQYLLWTCFMLFAKPPRSYFRFCHLGHLHCLKQALCGIISHSCPQCFTAICTQFKTFLSYS